MYDVIMEEVNSVADFHITPPRNLVTANEKGPQYAITIRHKSDGASFSIGWHDEESAPIGPYAIRYHPHAVLKRADIVAEDWQHVLRELRRWLEAIYHEGLPDLWAEDEQARLVRPAISEEYNTPFSGQEVDRITTSFNAALTEITQRQLLTAGQLQELTTFVNEKKHSASTEKRIDWQSTVVDGLIKFGFDKLAGSDAAKQVMDIIATQFHWLSHQIGPIIEKVTLLIRSGGG